MNTIKNLGRLAGSLTNEQLNKLEAGAALHLRHSNISFKVINYFGQGVPEVTIRVEQGKHLSGNYADAKTLVIRTNELFKPFLSSYIIHVHAVPYAGAIVDAVDQKWLADKMLSKRIKITDIVTDTGLDRTQISAWVNGLKPMSQIVKAMFYFYFTR